MPIQPFPQEEKKQPNIAIAVAQLKAPYLHDDKQLGKKINLSTESRRIPLKDFFSKFKKNLKARLAAWESNKEEFKKPGVEEIIKVLHVHVDALSPFESIFKDETSIGSFGPLDAKKLLKVTEVNLKKHLDKCPSSKEAIDLLKFFIEGLTIILAHDQFLDSDLFNQHIHPLAAKITKYIPGKTVMKSLEADLYIKGKDKTKTTVDQYIQDKVKIMIEDLSTTLDGLYKAQRQKVLELIQKIPHAKNKERGHYRGKIKNKEKRERNLPNAKEKEKREGYIKELEENWKILESGSFITAIGRYSPIDSGLISFITNFYEETYGDTIFEFDTKISETNDFESILELKLELEDLKIQIKAYQFVMKDKVEKAINELEQSFKLQVIEICNVSISDLNTRLAKANIIADINVLRDEFVQLKTQTAKYSNEINEHVRNDIAKLGEAIAQREKEIDAKQLEEQKSLQQKIVEEQEHKRQTLEQQQREQEEKVKQLHEKHLREKAEQKQQSAAPLKQAIAESPSMMPTDQDKIREKQILGQIENPQATEQPKQKMPEKDKKQKDDHLEQVSEEERKQKIREQPESKSLAARQQTTKQQTVEQHTHPSTHHKKGSSQEGMQSTPTQKRSTYLNIKFFKKMFRTKSSISSHSTESSIASSAQPPQQASRKRALAITIDEHEALKAIANAVIVNGKIGRFKPTVFTLGSRYKLDPKDTNLYQLVGPVAQIWKLAKSYVATEISSQSPASSKNTFSDLKKIIDIAKKIAVEQYGQDYAKYAENEEKKMQEAHYGHPIPDQFCLAIALAVDDHGGLNLSKLNYNLDQLKHSQDKKELKDIVSIPSSTSSRSSL